MYKSLGFKHIIGLLMVLALVWAQTAWAYGPFHPPMTEAEKTLAKIIQKVQEDGELPRYLLEHSSEDPVREAQNREMFTASLLGALQNAEADMVHTHCGGRYLKDEICGIKYNPVTCLDFERSEYLFRTDSAAAYIAGEYNAVIAYKLVEGTQIVATYNMLKVDGKWKLDGIDCLVGGSFNM